MQINTHDAASPARGRGRQDGSARQRSEPQAVGRCLSVLTGGAMAVACGLVLVMTLAFGYEVVARYFFNSPTGFVNQVAAYSMPLLTFLGAAWTLRTGGHVSVDILSSRLPVGNKALLEAVMETLSALLVAVVTVLACLTVVESYEEGTRSFSTAVTFPEFIPQLVMPFGLALLLMEQIRLCAGGWRRLWIAASAEAQSPVDSDNQNGVTHAEAMQ